MVYVIGRTGKPLMPCKNVIARLLLKQGKAKVKKRNPFTIKLLYDTTDYTQNLTLGIDTGSAHIGSAVSNAQGNIYYMAEIEIHNDITKKMTRRASYRRDRRSRKTRYRPARWRNRANSIKKNRFSPTMRSKLQSHVKEIEYVKSITPITRLVLETGNFDPHLMKNPEMNRHWGYQKGLNYGFANTKAKVLDRDSHQCQHCKTTKGTMEVHHIVFRSQGGSDKEDNLITLCHDCHYKLHHSGLKLKLKGQRKGQLKHATQMNTIRCQLLRIYPEAIETFGYVTKENRQKAGLSKEHYNDAVMIASEGKEPKFQSNMVYQKKCVTKGDYQQTKGVRSEMVIPRNKIRGFLKFDKVKYLGKEYFIKGRYSTGYAILMDISGQKISFKDMPKGWKTPKLVNMKRLEARSSWIISPQIIQSII
ncbi:MAG: HNH nuclease [Bacteriophage sp.]|nr:MAG: HNH nuclease [Bacteriophage sp.]